MTCWRDRLLDPTIYSEGVSSMAKSVVDSYAPKLKRRKSGEDEHQNGSEKQETRRYTQANGFLGMPFREEQRPN